MKNLLVAMKAENSPVLLVEVTLNE